MMFPDSIFLLVPGISLVVYTAFQLMTLRKIKKQINAVNRQEFVDSFGTTYKERILHSELSRYKWKKGIFTVRCDFDDTTT